MNVSTLLLLFSSFIAFRSTIAEHVVLLDTRTATSELNWKTWSNQEGRDGWLEETTYSEEQKVNHRIFSICEFGHIDNWLLVPAVDSNGEASRLQLEIGYNIAKCEKFLVLSKQKLTSCRETMKLYGMTLHGGEQLGNNWSNDTKWQYLETLVVKSESDTKHVLTVSYRVGQPLPTSRVHFALKNTGACAAVLYMKVYYNYCPETSQSFMKLPRTLPSADTNSVVTVMGSCVRNASPSFDIDSAVNNLSSRSKIAAPPPTFICKADGTWQSVGTSHCECNSGYVPSAKTNSCANAHSPQSSLNAFGGSHSSKLDVNKPSQSDNDWLSGIYSSQRVWLWLFIGLALPIMLCCVLCTIHRHNHKQQVADMVHLDNYKQANLPLISAYTPRSNLNGGVKLINNNRCFKPYVDPTTYEDPNMALNQFTNEIDMNCVNVTRVIGAGEFGEVCSGRLITVDAYGQHHEHVVAVKTLLSGSSPKAKSDFLMEALIMGQFEHENVIRLLGVVTKSEPVMILTEYMINGSLDSFLKRDDNKIEVSQLVEMLEGIAHGMKYLTDKGYVHRDLAARNVLVDDRLICKIADFGLSRGLSDSLGEQEYTTNNSEKIPIRWTAPEAIAHSKYTAASDVWSYGVMMWEVFSFGDRPYGSWTNHKVIDEVRSGYRLTPPMSTPNKLRELMCRCWAMERHERPTFGQILEELNNYRTEEFYFRQRPSPTRFVVNPYNNGR